MGSRRSPVRVLRLGNSRAGDDHLRCGADTNIEQPMMSTKSGAGIDTGLRSPRSTRETYSSSFSNAARSDFLSSRFFPDRLQESPERKRLLSGSFVLTVQSRRPGGGFEALPLRAPSQRRRLVDRVFKQAVNNRVIKFQSYLTFVNSRDQKLVQTLFIHFEIPLPSASPLRRP